jgi:hypothetical protein
VIFACIVLVVFVEWVAFMQICRMGCIHAGIVYAGGIIALEKIAPDSAINSFPGSSSADSIKC